MFLDAESPYVPLMIEIPITLTRDLYYCVNSQRVPIDEKLTRCGHNTVVTPHIAPHPPEGVYRDPLNCCLYYDDIATTELAK